MVFNMKESKKDINIVNFLKLKSFTNKNTRSNYTNKHSLIIFYFL